MATSVTFSSLYLHDASDFTNFHSWGVGDIYEVKESDGAVVTFANGRLRAITGSRKARTYEVTLPYIERNTLTDLDQYLNKPVMLRGPRGRVIFGQFFDYNIGEEMLPGKNPDDIPMASVTFTLHEISMTEEV